ncbi:MAG: hypothetical protein RL336_184, partial [Pseudomonadota bacterium]
MTDKQPGIIRRTVAALGRAISWLRVAVINLAFVVFLVVFLTAIFKSAPQID